MGNAVAVFNPAQVPAHIRARGISETAKALMGNVGGGKRISIRGSVFRMMDGSKEIASVEERYLDVVILKAAKISRVWYGKAYDADATAAPDCWSVDGDNPAPEVAEPQASRCADCPKNIAGSGQGNSRACRYQQRVALLLANDLEGDVFQLVVPAASLFGDADGDKRPLQAYAKYLVAQKLSPEDVVTRLRFDTSAESPKLFFKPMRWVDPDTEVSIVTEKAESEEAANAVEMHVAPQPAPAPAVEKELGARPKKKAAPVADDDEPAPPPKKKAAPVADDDEPAPPPKKKAAPVADDEDEPAPPPKKKAAPVADDDDAAEPPAKRASAPKKPAVADKKDLASMVSDWDDE
jgi:hypothetical protein